MIVFEDHWSYNEPIFINEDIRLVAASELLLHTNSEILIVKDNSEKILGYVNKMTLLSLTKESNGQGEITTYKEDIKYVKHGDVISLESLNEFSYFCLTDNVGIVGYLGREEVYTKYLEDRMNFLKYSIECARFGILSIDTKGRIKILNKRGRNLADIEGDMDEVYLTSYKEQYNDPSILEILKNEKEQLNRVYQFDDRDIKLLINRSPVYQGDKFLGAVSVYEEQGYLEELSKELEYVQNLNRDLQAVVDSMYDEVMVVDKSGKILRVSNKDNSHFWESPPIDLVGKNILELEKKGWFQPSITGHVLEKKRKISVIMENNFGQKILTSGNPIFSDRGKLERIIIAFRDITEMSKLKDELHQTMKETKKYKQQIEQLKSPLHLKRPFIYRSAIMREVLMQIETVSKVDTTVLVYGESGVGKEVVVENIHYLSDRGDSPFIKVNCGAIPEHLLESELFGYEKGAFTGASHKGKKGMFELANNGTLFLDEIGEMPLNLQVKLLQAIQDKSIMRVGGSEQVPINLRIITATNKNLEEMIENNTFREDLYYRLAVIPFYIPALRERTEDIEPIALYFLNMFNEKYNKEKCFSEDALEVLHAFHWPGNIRQLQNIVERVVVLYPNKFITAEDLITIIYQNKKRDSTLKIDRLMPLNLAKQQVEEQLLTLALKECDSTVEIAKALGISQPTAWRKIKELKGQ